MARLTPTAQPLMYAGLAGAHTAVSADGDVVPVGRYFLSIINGGSSITVTIQTPEVVDGDLEITDRVVTVPVSTTPMLIPLNSVHYRQPVGAAVGAGSALVDYSAITTVTRALVAFP